MEFEFLHVEDYEIFHNTFNGFFERTAYDVWFNWYVHNDTDALYPLTFAAVFVALVITLSLKIGCGLKAIKYARKNNPIKLMIYALGYLKVTILYPIIFTFVWIVLGFGLTIYYMLGYTL